MNLGRTDQAKRTTIPNPENDRAGSRFARASKPRGWMKLALVSMLTLLLFVGAVEIVARELFKEHPVNVCLDLSDGSGVVKGRPNCTCRLKTLESGWVTYHFNERGDRADGDYQAKAPGTYRIVLVGSSMAEGWTSPLDQSFAGRLPGLLTKATGRKVEVYDEGMDSSPLPNIRKRFPEALSANPDLILWTLTPWDILHATDASLNKAPRAKPMQAGTTTPRGLLPRIRAEYDRKHDVVGALRDRFRSFFMLQHLLYKSQSIYLAHSITGTDEYTPSIEAKPDASWSSKLQLLDAAVTDMAARAHAAGRPFVVMALPRHAQAVMIASGSVPAGLNPYAFGDQVKAIVEKHGGTYIDILHDFKNKPSVHDAFYPVDQHLEPAGQVLFARIIAKELTNGSVPSLAVNRDTRSTSETQQLTGGVQ